MENSLKQQKLEKESKVESKWIHQGKYIALKADKIFFDANHSASWEIVVHPGAVAIIPINDKQNLMLVKQWRRAANQILLELPAGTIENNELPLECAKREIQEEIGYKAATFISLGGFFSSPGFCTEYLHLFIAKDLSISKLPQDDHEAIDIVELSLNKALELIDKHQIHDAKTIAGILHYDRWLKNFK